MLPSTFCFLNHKLGLLVELISFQISLIYTKKSWVWLLLLLLLLLLLSLFSCVRLCATPQTAPYQAPRPWNFPGKNTGVGCHFILQCMKVKSESEVAQSCPTLSNCSLPGSSIHGIFQARVLEWVAIAFSESTRTRVAQNHYCETTECVLLTKAKE